VPGPDHAYTLNPEALRAALERRRRDHLYRRRRVVEGPQGVEPTVDGRRVLAFCSNDYLGLASHPQVIAAWQRGAAEYGVGSAASHLISGHSRAHYMLEEELADWLGRPRALLYSTGYMANLGVLSALLGPGDTVVEDRLDHASLIDAGRLSGAQIRRYAHADVAAARGQLARAREGRVLLATDGVFSMDGDLAPLVELAAACRHERAWLMVDDAHGLGVLGPEGRGTVALQRLGMAQVPVLMGTLGKALGTFGAFVAGDEILIETLIQCSRSYIYTTALPPASAQATRASLGLAREENWRRAHLQSLLARYRSGLRELGLPLADSATPIQPLVLADAQRVLHCSAGLWERGILVPAIRPPSVPRGQARLRVTLSALHQEHQVDRLLEALGEICAPV